MTTRFFVSLRNWISCFPGRPTVCIAAACAAYIVSVGVVSARSAGAPAVYTYHGNPFTEFSCGTDPAGGDICSIPNQYSSYTGADAVSITLTLDDALPANRSLQPVVGLPGFDLVMSDGHQTLTFADAVAYRTFVSTDANGRINGWSLGIYAADHWIESFSDGQSCCVNDKALLKYAPDTPKPFDFAQNHTQGTWTTGATGPDAAVRNLITTVANSGLTNGQVNSLTTKLNNVLASVLAGQNAQAINQLNAFINQVQAALRNGNIDAATAATLIAAANAIIAML